MKSPIKAVPIGRSGGRLNLFFMEMIIVLLFFGIASAVILSAFAAADRLSRESGRLERMSFCAQSAAEIFSETGSLEATAEKLFGNMSSQVLAIDAEERSMAALTLPLSDNCEYSSGEPSVFMTMSETHDEYSGGVLKTLHIKFEDSDGAELYSITSGAYLSDKRTVNESE